MKPMGQEKIAAGSGTPAESHAAVPAAWAKLMRDGKLDREAAAEALRRYLDTILEKAQLNLRFQIALHDAAGKGELEEPEIVVNFDGPDQELLLEHGGELLKALEYIGVRWLRLDPKMHDRVHFDCANYRAGRLEELKLSARVAAQRVRETHTAFRFNPMGARERRVIHLVLKDEPGIRTASEGDGDARQVVILPVDAK
jgi:spoIIIJ-associated protein